MLVYAKVEFEKAIREWDGFGFNYVQTAQSMNYTADPQDYGGFSILSEEKKLEILELVFGKDGLRPGVMKLFLDPFHQTEDHVNPQGLDQILPENYDHESTTGHMLEFVRRGLELTRRDGRDLELITTLYGPPPFMTAQKLLRGRDLDPAYREELAKYIVSWAKHLKAQGLPIRYLSIHNEGEDYHRWPYDGSHGNIGTGHDYNLWWTPEAVAQFVTLLRQTLDANGLDELGVTPGENTNWTRFYTWGYAQALADDAQAMQSLGLITSHGFSAGMPGDRWYGDHRSTGTDLLRSIRPKLHSWVTSTSWSKMDAKFLYQIYGNIYCAKVNAIIPWAGIQRAPLWVGGDPNPGNAIAVHEDGTYEVRDGYYYYKQVSTIGQPGMYVASTCATATEVAVIAFEKGATDNPNGLTIINCSDKEVKLHLNVSGCTTEVWNCTRTAVADNERYAQLADVKSENGSISLILPPNSATTLTEKA